VTICLAVTATLTLSLALTRSLLQKHPRDRLADLFIPQRLLWASRAFQKDLWLVEKLLFLPKQPKFGR